MSTYITADTIRFLREQRALTQSALAERIGVTDKAVSKWESGRGLFRVRTPHRRSRLL